MIQAVRLNPLIHVNKYPIRTKLFSAGVWFTGIFNMSAPEGNTGVKRIINAFFFSLDGFKACFRTEEAFRQEIYLTALMVPTAFWIGDTNVEQIVLLGSVVLVLITEMINTAIERAIDRISTDKHELSKEAKDMGSAVVFMALVFCAFTWLMIAIPKFF